MHQVIKVLVAVVVLLFLAVVQVVVVPVAQELLYLN
jgi:hypothetical protein